MEKLFDQAYDIINRASERTRSVYYIFLIINFALFLAAYSTEVYRRPGERVDDFLKTILCLQLPAATEIEKFGTIDCPSAKIKAKAWGYDLPTLKEVNNQWFKDISTVRIQELLRQDVASRQVKIPIVGLSFDVDLLWLLTSYSGPLGMLIIISCLRVEIDLIGIAKAESILDDHQERNTLIKLLLSTQVLLGKTTNKTSLIEQNTQIYKSIFMHSIFLLPIFTQFLEMYNDFDISDLVAKQWVNIDLYLFSEIKRHYIMESIKIISELFSLILMIALFWRFVSAARQLRLSYKNLQEGLESDEAARV